LRLGFVPAPATRVQAALEVWTWRGVPPASSEVVSLADFEPSSAAVWVVKRVRAASMVESCSDVLPASSEVVSLADFGPYSAAAWAAKKELWKSGSEFVDPCPVCGGADRLRVADLNLALLGSLRPSACPAEGSRIPGVTPLVVSGRCRR